MVSALDQLQAGRRPNAAQPERDFGSDFILLVTRNAGWGDYRRCGAEMIRELDSNAAEPGIGRLHLSPRQEQILALIARGKSDGEIAKVLSISPRTVGSHLQRVYQLHGLHTRAAAVAAWLSK